MNLQFLTRAQLFFTIRTMKKCFFTKFATAVLCVSASLFSDRALQAEEKKLPRPPSFTLTSSNSETSMGLQAFQEMKQKMKVSRDPEKRALVSRIINRMVPYANIRVPSWEFEIFEDATPNAFALPGGRIGVHTGMFPVAQNETGLAVVLGHEISHVELRHGARRMDQQIGFSVLGGVLDGAVKDSKYRQLYTTAYAVGGNGAVLLPYSRSHEREADRLGLWYMAMAGYNPSEAPEFWRRMGSASQGGKPPEWLSTHPSDENRIKEIQGFLPSVIPIYEGRKGSY